MILRKFKKKKNPPVREMQGFDWLKACEWQTLMINILVTTLQFHSASGISRQSVPHEGAHVSLCSARPVPQSLWGFLNDFMRHTVNKINAEKGDSCKKGHLSNLL